MELTPQTLHAVEFREARRGGYNTRDVDDFIERVAGGVAQLNERVREARARAEGAEARVVEAQRELEELRRRPMPLPEASETDETLRRTLVLAQRTADATIKEAKEEANRVLSEAREEAARTRTEAEAEARRGAETARVKAQQEVETLLANRDKLKIDLEALTRRINDQREQLRLGISEMQRLLDETAALNPLPPLELADVERPAPLEPALAADPGLGEDTGSEATDGGGLAEVGSSYVPGAPAASPEPPGAPPDLGPPTPAVPFAVGGEGRGPWLPSELRPPADEPLGPAPAAPTPPPADAVPGVGPEQSGRPSEWGRAVFDRDRSEGEGPRFGGRRT